MMICNEVDNLVDESGVTGHKSELMMSSASRTTWRGFSVSVAARPRLQRIHSKCLHPPANVSNLPLGKDPLTPALAGLLVHRSRGNEVGPPSHQFRQRSPQSARKKAARPA